MEHFLDISYKKSRVRGDNWTQEEKDLFLEIMEQSSPIIDNKLTDTNTNKRKYLEWLHVQKKFEELTGSHRDIPQMKGFWRRCKLSAKKPVSQHRKAVKLIRHKEPPRTSSPPSEDSSLNIKNEEASTETNVEVNVNKNRATQLIEEEYAMKIKYQEKELAHQQVRHKIEIELLLLEKERKMLELEILKKI